MAVLNEYTLENRVFAITLDNAAANNKTMNDILTKRPISGFHEELLHCRCACHIINLIVEKCEKLILPHITRIRNCISFLNGSNTRKNRFFTWCRGHNVEPVNFQNDCETRWNSIFTLYLRN